MHSTMSNIYYQKAIMISINTLIHKVCVTRTNSNDSPSSS